MEKELLTALTNKWVDDVLENADMLEFRQLQRLHRGVDELLHDTINKRQAECDHNYPIVSFMAMVRPLWYDACGNCYAARGRE